MPEKKKQRNPKTTLAIVVSCLVLGVPIAGVAVDVESTFMPTVPLKDPNTIDNGTHLALYAACVLSMVAGVVVALGSVILRHMSPKNVAVGFVTFGMGVLNVVGQLIILAFIYIAVATHPESKSRNEVRFVNGQYDANGKRFTRETFSCMMGNLYLDREPWSTNACSEYHYARYTTILMTGTAAILLPIAWWPVRNYLFGRNKQNQGKI